MEYIDAKKLKAEIERQQRRLALISNTKQVDIRRDCALQNGIYDSILGIINYLQQEQESVAERFARIVRGNLIGIDKEVQQKFEQLYFEITGTKMYGGYKD